MPVPVEKHENFNCNVEVIVVENEKITLSEIDFDVICK